MIDVFYSLDNDTWYVV